MSSKYDLVKVSIQLPDGGSYVLSRFLLARILHFCELRRDISGKVALAVKKGLIVGQTLTITRAQLLHFVEAILTIERVPKRVVELYPVVDKYFLERIPLLIVVATGGPSEVSTKICSSICSRLLNPTLLQTQSLLEYTLAARTAVADLDNCVANIMHTLMTKSAHEDQQNAEERLFESFSDAVDSCNSQDDELAHSPIVCRASSTDKSLLWRAECDTLRSSVVAHARKAIKEGRELLIAGSHFDKVTLEQLMFENMGLPSKTIKIAIFVDDVTSTLMTNISDNYSSVNVEIRKSFESLDALASSPQRGRKTPLNILRCDEPVPLEGDYIHCPTETNRPLILRLDAAGAYIADWVHRAVLTMVVAHMNAHSYV